MTHVAVLRPESVDDPLIEEIFAWVTQMESQVNVAPQDVTDQAISQLRTTGLTDKGIVQLIHMVSDFASYNWLNLAL